jgi:hypothetical protein
VQHTSITFGRDQVHLIDLHRFDPAFGARRGALVGAGIASFSHADVHPGFCAIANTSVRL